MTIFEKIRARSILRNKKTCQIVLDYALVHKDVLKYYNNILPKYGFTLIVQKTGNDQNVKSYWCNKNRAKNIKAFDIDQTLYVDNKITVDMYKTSLCEGCTYYSKCFNGN